MDKKEEQFNTTNSTSVPSTHVPSNPIAVPSTKEELINNIKEWIKMDNDIAKLKAEIKDRTNKKKLLTTNLVNVMKTNSIDCFDINDGSLVYKQTKAKKAITGKTLLAALQTYYKEQPNLAEDLTKHVLDNREEVVRETIKRRVNK